MNTQELGRMVRKYYGYVADMEGSGIETVDLLFVRDKIQRFVDNKGLKKEIPNYLYEQIHDLDRLLWEERETFLMVVGEKELQHAKGLARHSRSHWWWYLDELRRRPQSIQAWRDQLAQVFALA